MSQSVTISELPEKLMEAAFTVLLLKASEIQELAQATVPVKTGRLRDSIKIVINQNSDDIKSISVVATAPYAAIVEAKQPYLGPAFNAVQPSIEAELKQLQGIVDNVKQ